MFTIADENFTELGNALVHFNFVEKSATINRFSELNRDHRG